MLIEYFSARIITDINYLHEPGTSVQEEEGIQVGEGEQTVQGVVHSNGTC